MRVDSFLSLRIALPLLRLKRSHKPRLPILMYHSISDDAEPHRTAYYKVCTAPKRFAQQMDWLSKNGYEGVTLTNGLKQLNASTVGTNPKPVAITFDDGFRDFFTEAFPILKQYGFSATMFLPTGFIGEESLQFQSRDCMNWRDVEELNAAGIEFGSHTVTHPKLVETDWPDIEAELSDSRKLIESRIGVDVRSFAYPYAFPKAKREYVGRFRKTLEETGYTSCVTTEVGRVGRESDAFALQRLPINNADDTALLTAKLEGAYDWIAVPQNCAKLARNFFYPQSGGKPGSRSRALSIDSDSLKQQNTVR